MARIPGTTLPTGAVLGDSVPQVRRLAIQGGTDAVQRGAQHLAERIGQIANEELELQAQQKNAADRLTAAQFSLEYAQTGKAIAQRVQERLQRGEFPDEDEAQAAFQQEMAGLSNIERPKVGKLIEGDLTLGLERTKAELAAGFDGVLRQSRVNRAESSFSSIIDAFGKEAQAPDADIDGINTKLRLAGEQAVAAGVPMDRVEQLRQGASDRNWYNAGAERVMRGKNSMAELNAIEADLTKENGKYYQKMDTDRRNALLAQVLNAKDRLMAKAEAAQAKRDSSAEKALAKMEQIIVSGFPVSDELRAQTAAATRGTKAEEGFRDLLGQERQVQDFLKRPISEQQSFIIEQERKMRSGGVSDPKEIALYRRLTSTFDKNIKAVQDTPLEWNEGRTGEQMPRITAAALVQPNGLAQVGALLQDRLDTLAATRKSHGDVVGNRPLFQEEAAEIGAGLKAMSPTARARTLGQLAQMIDDPIAFRGLVKQTLGDDPIAYAAGLANGLGLRTQATRGGMFGTTVIGGRNVGDLIEQGAMILKDKSVIVPPKGSGDDGARAFFNQELGDAVAPGSEMRELYFQSSLSIYAKLASEEGKLGKQLDSRLMQQAINIATGGMVEVRGQKILAPRYGMSDEELTDGLNTALRAAADANGLDYGRLVQMKLVPDDRAPGRFLVKQDELNYQPDRNGRPLVIEVR